MGSASHFALALASLNRGENTRLSTSTNACLRSPRQCLRSNNNDEVLGDAWPSLIFDSLDSNDLQFLLLLSTSSSSRSCKYSVLRDCILYSLLLLVLFASYGYCVKKMSVTKCTYSTQYLQCVCHRDKANVSHHRKAINCSSKTSF
mgnify:CR=1 FL=1